MTDSETTRDISEKPSSIVRIAYHQLNVMCGTRDPTVPVASDTDANAVIKEGDMSCTCRLLDLPLFVTSTLRNVYVMAKNSHESVATILCRAEDGMRAGLQLASPVTDRIAGVLETPLKAVDNAVCISLDFVEKMPSVRLPSEQTYANMRDCVRNIFTSVLDILRLLFSGSKNQIEDLSVASETVQEEVRKIPS